MAHGAEVLIELKSLRADFGVKLYMTSRLTDMANSMAALESRMAEVKGDVAATTARIDEVERRVGDAEDCHEHNKKRSECCGAPFNLHPPPCEEEDLRLWLKALNFKHPHKRPYVCSYHFVEGKPTPEHPFPQKWLGYEAPVKRTRRVLVRVSGLPLDAFNLLADDLTQGYNNCFLLHPKDQLLMTLMKLRLNLLQDDLAERFRVSQPIVSKVTSCWLDLMEEKSSLVRRRDTPSVFPELSQAQWHIPALVQGGRRNCSYISIGRFGCIWSPKARHHHQNGTYMGQDLCCCCIFPEDLGDEDKCQPPAMVEQPHAVPCLDLAVNGFLASFIYGRTRLKWDLPLQICCTDLRITASRSDDDKPADQNICWSLSYGLPHAKLDCSIYGEFFSI
ncbi:hypothetical protein SRHO_G00037900 [Serrasalmus rhombeus]